MGLAAVSIKDALTKKIFDWDLTRKPQRIRKLKITPQPSAAIFSFRTVQPTVPVIEIFRSITGDAAADMKPENLVATAFNFIDAMLGNLFTEHKARMTGLPQGSRFHYRITAGDGSHPSAVVIGTFATCFRRLSVTVRDIMVFNDGDPGLKASGEFQFYFGFYFEQSLETSREYDANIESGEVRDFPLGKGATFVTGHVPDSFSVFVRGVEYDWLGSPLPGWGAPPASRPETLAAYENDLETAAEAMQTFDMPQAPGSYILPLALKSGPHGIHFWVNGRVEVEVLPPSEPPVVPFDYLLTVTDIDNMKLLSLAGAGSRGGVGGGGKIHAFAIGPESMLYMKRPDEAQWVKLDDGAAMAAADCACDFTAEIARDDHERIHILTMRAGTLRHASLSARGRSEAPRFRTVGEGLQRHPTVVSAGDGTAYVLARDRGGALKVAPLTGSDRGRWVELGGNFGAPVCAHATRQKLEIVGVTPDGRPVGAAWRIGSGRKPDWVPLGRGLGRTRLRHLDLLVDRARIHVMALAEDRRLLTLSRGRDGEAWKDHGSLDAFLFKPIAAAAKPGRSSARGANGSARPVRRRGATADGAAAQA